MNYYAYCQKRFGFRAILRSRLSFYFFVLGSCLISRTAFCAPGDLYISTGLRELGQKNEILRLDATGALNIFVAGGNFYGLAFDRAGNLYAATGQGGSVTKYGTDGSRGIFASGMGLALGLTFDGTGILFV